MRRVVAIAIPIVSVSLLLVESDWAKSPAAAEINTEMRKAVEDVDAAGDHHTGHLSAEARDDGARQARAVLEGAAELAGPRPRAQHLAEQISTEIATISLSALSSKTLPLSAPEGQLA